MRIQVKVVNQASPQLKQVQANINQITKASVAASQAAQKMSFAGRMAGLERGAKNLQWVGRQIEFNFTLPLLLAGAAAGKWAMANEQSFVRVKKVYGDMRPEMQAIYKQEIPLIQRGFVALSNTFGVHQDQVNEIGAAWAQAGFSGIALAKATKLTMETMILGEMEATDATDALIQVQAQWGFSMDHLLEKMAALNMIENETQVSTSDLIQALARGGPVARAFGVSIEEFMALTASIARVAGSAAVSGNALKTIMTRVMAPGKIAADMFKELHLKIKEADWNSKNFTERLKLLAPAFTKTGKSAQAYAAKVIFGQYQIARGEVLLADLVSEHGRFAKALEVSGDSIKNMAQRKAELDMVMLSGPQAFKILTTQIRNAMSQAIVPLIPFVLALLSAFTRMTTAFANMNPQMQKIILMSLVMLAAIGPLARYIGAFGLLLSTATKGFVLLFGGMRMVNGVATPFAGLLRLMIGRVASLGGAIIWLVKAHFRLLMAGFEMLWKVMAALVMDGFGAVITGLRAVGAAIVANLGWIALIAIAVGVLAYIFKDQLGDALKWVQKNWNRLPEVIMNAMGNVIRVVASAIKVVREWLSYLNPFARHSPSLVDQVNAGVQAIIAGYSRLNKLGTVFSAATDSLKRFNEATQEARDAFEQADWDEQRLLVLGAAGENAARIMDLMTVQIRALRTELKNLEIELVAQQEVVDAWAAALKSAEADLKSATAALGEMKSIADGLNDELDAAKDRLSTWMDSPIEGMGAMSDAIFENEMAQKKLRLEMMKLEDSVGPIDEVRDRLAALAGDIEMARGLQSDLRKAGAGSDALGAIDQQIAEMEAASRALEAGGGSGPAAQMAAMQKELDALGRKGEMLDLENSLKFDPLTRQIEQAGKSMAEMPFAEIMAGIQTESVAVDRLTAAWTAADAAVSEQQMVVDALDQRKNAVQDVYDTEQEKLRDLQSVYSDVENQIRDMEAAFSSFASAAKAKEAKGDKIPFDIQAFRDAGDGTFADKGEGIPLGQREDGNLEELVKKWEQDSKKAFGSFDIFAPIGKAWEKTKTWLGEQGSKIGEFLFGGKAKSNLQNAAGTLMSGDMMEKLDLRGKFADAFGGIVETVKITLMSWRNIFTAIWEAVGPFVELFLGFFKDFGEQIGGELMVWFKQIGPPLIEAIGNITSTIAGIIAVVAVVILGIWQLLWPVLLHVAKPILDMIVSVIRGAMQFIRGIIMIVLGLINGDWHMVWNGLLTALNAVWDLIVAAIKGAIGIVIGIFRGLLEGIINIFESIWDFLFGHSIIPDILDAFKAAFTWLFNFMKGIWDAIWNAIKFVWNTLISFLKLELEGLKNIWNAAWTVIKTVVTTIWDGIKIVISAAWNFIKDVVTRGIDGIKNIMGGIGDFLHNTVGAAFSWIGDHISGVFNGILDVVTGIWDKITEAIRAGVNFGIDAINGLIGAVNAVSKFLHIGLNISPLSHIGSSGSVAAASGPSSMAGRVPQKTGADRAYASGGILPRMAVGSGGAVRGARAIVGEGSRQFDEFVIPTDPKHRGRARDLWAQLTQRLGLAGRKPETGGFGLHTITDTVGDVANAAKDTALDLLVKPLLGVAKNILNKIPIDFIRNAGLELVGRAYDWMKGEEQKGGTIHGKGFQAIIDWFKGTGVANRVTSTTGGEHAAGSMHYAGRAVDFAGLSPGRDTAALGNIFKAFGPVEAQLAELIYAGPQASYNIKGGKRVAKYAQDDHHDHVHAALRAGGIVRRSHGGTVARIGEGANDEMVTPLPRGFRVEDMGKKEIHFHGDLSFPNIKNGDDAEKFIRNLESLTA